MKDNQGNVDVSIIIPCKNEVNNLKWTIDSLIKSQNSHSFEVIVVDDGSQDGSSEFLENDSGKKIYSNVILIKTNSIGAALARNAGAVVAKGKYLFFCDAHVKVPDRWLDSLLKTLKRFKADLVAPCITSITNPSAVGYGQKWDKNLKIQWLTKRPRDGQEIPLAGGAALGITKNAFEKINGFNNLFQVWGREDEELCFKAWLYGYKIVINPNIKVEHLFRKKHPYEVDNYNIIYNTLCFAYSHFGEARLMKIIKIAKKSGYYSKVEQQIKQNKKLILEQREKFLKERSHNDNYFFKKFNIRF